MLFVDNPTDPNVPATANNINDNYSETSCDTTHECRERMVITDGSKITKIQGNRTSNGVLDQNIGSLHITFQRPDPEPTIRGITGADTRDYYYVEIWLTSKDGLITKKIAVWKTGMVAILQ
ncbi:MAG: hypothetical protein NT098_03665 [Candidatus Parcubacteria bacterium]|nr:hypothetical protein [Candidatus Parcubacteria bacterium]